MTRLVLVLLAVVGALGAPQAGPAPSKPIVCETPAKPYGVCKCSGAQDLVCDDATLTQALLSPIFNAVKVKTFGSLTIKKASDAFTTIPKGTFGNATFTSVDLNSLSKLADIDEGTFDKSMATLTAISISDCEALDPTKLLSKGLAGFTKLTDVMLSNLKPKAATLKPITAKIASSLTIRDFELKEQLEADFAKATGAEKITLRNLTLTTLPATAFPVANSSVIDLSLNNLTAAKIDNTTLVFADNKTASFTLNLRNNTITQLKSSVFEPIFEKMLPVDKKYQFHIQGNQLDCGCEMSWIFCNENYTQILMDQGNSTKDGATCSAASNMTFTELNICNFSNCTLDDACKTKLDATKCSGAGRASATSMVVAAVLAAAFLIKM